MARQKKGEVKPKPIEAEEESVTEEVEEEEVEETPENRDISDFDVIDGFVLENPDKLQRVIEGEVGSRGVAQGGLLEKYGELSKIPPAEVLAYYDKIGGLVTKDIGSDIRVKIKTGSFWDTRARAPRVKPKVVYLFMVSGDMVEVDDPSKLAHAITTINTTKAEQERKNEERKQRAKRKSIVKTK